MGLRTLVDCGMFILIWMVQLIVYPSFCHISDEALPSWHRIYTQRIGYFVMPMMLAQLTLSLLTCIHTTTALTALDLGLVVATWVLTAWLAVPLHKALAAGSVDHDIRRSLVRTNLPRALLWTAIFFLGILKPESTQFGQRYKAIESPCGPSRACLLDSSLSRKLGL